MPGLSAIRFANPRRALTRAALGATTLTAAGAIGLGTAAAGASPALVDSPVPAPGSTAGSAAGVNAANSFLQVLNGMLNKVVPGAGSLMPSDVSSLTPPGAGAPGAPLPGPAPAAPVPQTLAGAWTVH